MASVNKDPRGRSKFWYACYTDADGVRRRVSTEETNQRIAEKFANAKQRAEDERRKGTISTQRIVDLLNDTLRSAGLETIKSIPLKSYLDEWLANKRSISAATRFGYEHAFREFFEFLGSTRSKATLESISEREINGFMDQLRDAGRSPGTVNKIVRSLSVPFKHALETGKIRYNPVKATERLPHQGIVKGKFEPQHVAMLVAAAAGDWQGAILFGYGHAARLQDVANLRWSSLDTENGVVRFTERKTDKVAVIGLHADFMDWLEQQPAPEDPDAFVFPTLANQRGGGRNGLSEQFSRIVRLAGIDAQVTKSADGKGRSTRLLSFHSLRHTAASEVFNAESTKEVQRRVTNHARGGVVERYTHRDLALIKQASALIPRVSKRCEE